MRALKTLLIILGAVLALGLVLGLMGPKHTHLAREATINAPVATVWAHTNSLKAMDAWSPWREKDVNMKVTFDGQDGAVGSKMMWEGNSDVGQGSQELVAVEPEKHLGSKLVFIKPFEGESMADVNLVPKGDSTTVTWSFDGDNNFIGRIMCVLMSPEKMMGPVFEGGLLKLKHLCEDDAAKSASEAKAKTYRGYTIETVDRPEMVYIGKREVVKWDKMSQYFAKNFPAMAKSIGGDKLEMAGAPSGVYFKWDEAKKEADMMAAMPVKAGADTKVKGWETFVVPAGKALFIPYHGAYEKSGEAHMAMDEMMKANNMSLRDVVIEEYITDPMTEKDTAKWVTNIYYMIK